MNNGGDAFSGGSGLSFRPKWMERGVVDYYTSLWNAKWPHDPNDPVYLTPWCSLFCTTLSLSETWCQLTCTHLSGVIIEIFCQHIFPLAYIIMLKCFRANIHIGGNIFDVF